MGRSDEDIVKGCREDRSWAIRAVADFITPIVRNELFSIESWEDVRQDCLLKIQSALKKTPVVQNLWGLAHKIAICTVIDYNRKRRVEERIFARQHDVTSETAESMRIRAATAASNPIDYESADLFLYIFQRLEETCQKIIEGLFIRGLSYAELAEELGLSQGNLRIRLKRCRDRARQLKRQID